ncbi:MAG: hypothetical protein NVS3B10_17300 [Polyangiales bacterium]
MLRWFWTAVSAIAPPTLAVVVGRLGMGRAAALAAGVTLAVAPSFAHTAHQVLTDAPALALSLLALAIAMPDDGVVTARRALLAGVVLSFAIATRETAAVQAIALAALLAPRRAHVALALAAVAVGMTVLIVIAKREETMLGWIQAMARSSEKHPLSLRDLGLSIGWLLALGPLPVVVGVIEVLGFTRRRWSERLSRPTRISLVPVAERDTLSDPSFAKLRAIVAPSAVATALLVLYPDGSFSPRYLLATGPIAFLILAAPRVSAMLQGKARVLTALAIVFPLAVAPLTTAKSDSLARRADAVHARLAVIPDRALVAPGHVCPAIGAWLAADAGAALPRTGADLPPEPFELLCPGWSWPGDAWLLARRLDRARCFGRTVLLDAHDDAWLGTREQDARADVRAYVAQGDGREELGWTRFEPLPFDDVRCR